MKKRNWIEGENNKMEKKCNKEKWRWRIIEKEVVLPLKMKYKKKSLRQMFGMEIDESHNDGKGTEENSFIEKGNLI